MYQMYLYQIGIVKMNEKGPELFLLQILNIAPPFRCSYIVLVLSEIDADASIFTDILKYLRNTANRSSK